ncbi:MAG: zinc metallopeptidase [Clostridia bacterium]|nr:zinc metallopeptidase [Clostridia bacterium]
MDFSYLILIPALILSLWAQFSVQSAYKKYGAIRNARGITGRETSQRILNANGISNVQIAPIAGELTDNYNPKTNVISLSQGVYDQSSIAAVSVAAHETGHAIQHAVGYAAIKARNAILPVTQIASMASMPLLLIGFVLGLLWLVRLGIIMYAAVLLFQVVTLPVEFNASSRALKTINEMDILDGEELKGAKKMLRAAAMTYVAAAATSALQLLRFIMIANSGRRD